MTQAIRSRRERRLTALVYRAVLGASTLGIGCAALTLRPAPCFAQASPDELARRHFESGAAYLEESDYENALLAFEKAFELSKRPEVQINIASVHERMGNLKAAIQALDTYLELAPEGEHRQTVELRRANLQKRVDQGEGVGTPTPDPVPEPKPAAKPAPAPVAKPAPSAPPRDTGGDAGPEAAGTNVPAWIFIGVGGLSAIGAATTGFFAQREYDDAESSCSPACTDDQLSDGRSLALTSTILTGVAVVGVGVGLTLLLTQGGGSKAAHETPRQRQARLRRGLREPQLFVGAGPQGGAAHALWRF